MTYYVTKKETCLNCQGKGRIIIPDSDYVTPGCSVHKEICPGCHGTGSRKTEVPLREALVNLQADTSPTVGKPPDPAIPCPVCGCATYRWCHFDKETPGCSNCSSWRWSKYPNKGQWSELMRHIMPSVAEALLDNICAIPQQYRPLHPHLQTLEDSLEHYLSKFLDRPRTKQ